ncbi:hypothetical protein [Aestuariivirga sp.]|uniref:hypothetical protein n=1 Tax=Aestuariivirga sp. TaxID=2650926 RepID=UPI0039E5201C
MKTRAHTFLLICLSTTALSLPARADSVPPVVRAMIDNWSSQLQVQPTYDSLEDDGAGNITIKKLSVIKPAAGEDPAMNLVIDEVDLKGVTDEGNNVYQISNIAVDNLVFDVDGPQGKVLVSMPSGSAEGVYVKDAGSNPTPDDAFRAAMTVAKKVTTGKVTLDAMGQTVTSDGYESNWDGDPKTGAGTFSTKVSNIVIPEGMIAMMDQQGILKQLGYSGLTFDLTGDGKMDVSSGKLGLDYNFAFIGKDMGNLRFGFGVADVPIAAYAELQKSQKTGAPPDFSALMPELQSVLVNSFTFRFEDSSITKKLLPLIAAMQGTTADALVANAGAMVQVGTMSLNNPAFTTQVVTAVNNFLKDPKSITVSLKPDAPLKVQEIMTLNPNNPGEAITKLGVNVTAND